MLFLSECQFRTGVQILSPDNRHSGLSLLIEIAVILDKLTQAFFNL